MESPGGTGTRTQGAEDGLPHLGLSSNPAIPGFQVVSRYSEPTMLLLCVVFFLFFFSVFLPCFVFFCYLSDLRFFNGSANGTGSQMRDDSPAAGDRQITSSPGSRRPQTPNKGSPRRCGELSALGEGAPPVPWVLHGCAGCGWAWRYPQGTSTFWGWPTAAVSIQLRAWRG